MSRLRSRQGFTLTECIVSFVLLSFLMLGCCQLISSGYQLYYSIKTNGACTQVCDTIMTKICTELENYPGSDISADNGRLVIVREGEDEAFGFDDQVYEGFSIASLDISWPEEDYGEDVRCVSLVLEHKDYGEFTFTRYVRSA